MNINYLIQHCACNTVVLLLNCSFTLMIFILIFTVYWHAISFGRTIMKKCRLKIEERHVMIIMSQLDHNMIIIIWVFTKVFTAQLKETLTRLKVF